MSVPERGDWMPLPLAPDVRRRLAGAPLVVLSLIHI